MHFDDVSREMIQCRVVGKDEILVNRQAKSIPNLGHDFGLLDRINAEFTFEVLIHFDEVSGIASMAHHH